MLNELRKKISNFISPTVTNSMSLPNEFLRYGNKTMTPDWTQVIMSDKDIYTGYFFAAIRRRANGVARAALEYLKTETNKDGFEHPYLQIIEDSPGFSDYDFWSTISTFLDLEGVYYLMAVRNFDENRKGKIKEFVLLNPYNIRRILDKETLKVTGYVESRLGLVREIPPEMIIEMRELNPFDENKPYAMSDAAKESQFTMKTAGDFTRHAFKHNINAPGILSTDVILEDEDFKNFTERVKNHTKGEPIFGNGKGSITWNNMNIELAKSALKDVKEMSREEIFAISGVSKTIMGIEQSGTTRETARVQKDLFMEGELMPRIQLIIDALNQDYRNTYPDEWNNNRAKLIIDSPTKTDHDSDQKDTEVKQTRVDLYNGLLNLGYDAETSAQYVNGDIDIEQLGEPDRTKAIVPIELKDKEDKEDKDKKENKEEENSIKVINQIEDAGNNIIKDQAGALKNAVINIEQQIVLTATEKILKKVENQFEEESDIITKKDKNSFINDLEIALIAFYGIVISLQGGKTIRKRIKQYSLFGQFKIDRETNKYIKEISKTVADSHINTIVDDVLVTAREAALKGLGRDQTRLLIKEKYNNVISSTRAETIARTETNRAFTRAQYEADKQFIDQNKLSGRAYKQWITRSDNPCAFCTSLAREGKIPFSQDFRGLGDNLIVDGKTLAVNFEALQAGNAHPNCSCIYELILELED